MSNVEDIANMLTDQRNENINLKVKNRVLVLENERLLGLIESCFRIVSINREIADKNKWQVEDLKNLNTERDL